MNILYRILLVLHITSAAVLFGGAIGLVRSLRQNVGGQREVFLAIARDAARRGRAMGVGSMATLITGLALIFTLGGFGSVPLQIHIALALLLVAMATSAALIQPQMLRLVHLAEAPTLDGEAAKKSIKLIAMGQGILHLLWIVILVLMIIH